MGPIWGRQDPGGPHVDPMNFAILIPTFFHKLLTQSPFGGWHFQTRFLVWNLDIVYWFEFHWNLFPVYQLAISQHFFLATVRHRTGDKPLPEPMLIKMRDAIWPHLGHSGLMVSYGEVWYSWRYMASLRPQWVYGEVWWGLVFLTLYGVT